MARPGKYNLDLYRGDTYEWQFVVWQDDEMTLPADLTGLTAKAEIDGAAGSITLVCSITTNVVHVKLPLTAWTGWQGAAGTWDLQLSDVDTVITIVAGTVVVTGDVTESQPLGVATAARRQMAFS